jgi:uncharacterized protein YecT (DUF1311 family)
LGPAAGLGEATASARKAPPEEKKTSPTEARAAWAKADGALNQAWEALRKAKPEAEFKALQEDQRTWLHYRDEMAQGGVFGTGGEPPDKAALQSPPYLTALTDLTNERVNWLQCLLKPLPTSPLTGVWSDSFGGNISIVEQGGRIYFTLNVVRGRSLHVGELSGFAAWNPPIGWFTDKGREKEKTDETNLSFVLRNERLQLTGANTSYYHGMRAHFDGDYMKVAELSAAEQKKVLQEAQDASKPQ